jgi:long-chain acyl-CoA synthetase
MKENNVDGYQKVRNIVSLKHMLNTSVELYHDRPAFLVKMERGGSYHEIKYNQLKNDVDALGTKLMELGLLGTKIAIIGENCYQWIVTYLAVVNGVGVVVPLDKELNKEETTNLLETADCKAIFFTDTYEEFFQDYKIDYKVRMNMYGDRTDLNQELPIEPETDGVINWESLVGAGEKMTKEGDRRYVDLEVDAEEMRMILFSSGTTGKAKGIMLCHRNIVINIMDTRKIVEVDPTDRTLSILPIHHTFECTIGVLTMLYSGASIAFYEGLKYVSKNLVEAEATILVGVPLIFESVYSKIWKQAEKTGKAEVLKKAIKVNHFLKSLGISVEKKLFRAVHDSFGGKLRLMVTGAAAIDPNVCRGFEDLGIRMVQGYGLTECAPLVTGPDFKDTYKKAGSVGKAVASGEIKIIDADSDGIGEVIYRGPNVMLGYYNMPEETAEVIKDGWFYTGDLGFLDEDGWLYLTGRKKNVIVTKTGKNIYPEEVELYVNRNKYIQESLVHGIEEDTSDGTTVSVQIRPAYDVIYEEFGNNFDDDSIYTLIKKAIGEINESLPIYKRIRNISVRKDEFIKTTTKKIKRYQNIK